MKLELTAERGEVAERTDDALEALMKAVLADGGDSERWENALKKALGGHPQTGRPRFKVMKEAVAEAQRMFDTAMAAAKSELRELLKDAAGKVDKKHYRDQL